MEVVGTKEAFAAMLQQRGIYKSLNVDTSTVANWKKYLREGKSISLDKMEEMLLKAGSKIKQEKVWIIDNISYEGLQNNMANFYEELEEMKVGDSIEVNFSSEANMDESLVMSSVFRHAHKIGALLSRSNTGRPIVIYNFINKHI